MGHNPKNEGCGFPWHLLTIDPSFQRDIQVEVSGVFFVELKVGHPMLC